MNDELNIKGVDYKMILDVASSLHSYSIGYNIEYEINKVSMSEEEREVALLKIKNLLRFNDVLIKWLKENKVES